MHYCKISSSRYSNRSVARLPSQAQAHTNAESAATSERIEFVRSFVNHRHQSIRGLTHARDGWRDDEEGGDIGDTVL